MYAPHSSSPQLSDADLNLAWVFSQLVSSDAAGSASHSDGRPNGVKRRASLEAMSGGDDGGGGATLTARHIQRALEFMRVTITTEEAEEVLQMMDDNADGRVTIEDFCHTMKVDPAAPFDPRYAVQVPFASLDGATRDGVLTDEDYRAARAQLGRAFGCDNDGEFHQIMRAVHATPVQTNADGSSAAGPTTPALGPTQSPIISPRPRAQLSLGKDMFKSIVGAPRDLTQDGSTRTLAASRSDAGSRLPRDSSFGATADANMVISLTPATPTARDIAMSGLRLNIDASPQAAGHTRAGTFPALTVNPAANTTSNGATAAAVPQPPHSARQAGTPRKATSRARLELAAPIAPHTMTHSRTRKSAASATGRSII